MIKCISVGYFDIILIHNGMLWFWTNNFNYAVVSQSLQRLHCQLVVVVDKWQSLSAPII